MKKIYLLLALCLSVHIAYAQKPVADVTKESAVEKPVGTNPITFNAAVRLGAISVANHYMSSNEYGGLGYGVHFDFGRFYKPGKDVTWNLAFDYTSSFDRVGGLENNPRTSFMSYSALALNYSSFYSWLFGKGLIVKVGGGLDLSGDVMTHLVHQSNNAASVNALMQLEAAAGISYTIKFKKWMLGFSGNLTTPFAGLVFTDAKHESGFGSLSSDRLMGSYFSHLKATSFSNFYCI